MARFMNNKNRHRRGAAIVEAAIVFPLLVVLTLAVIEYGWMFMQIHHVTNAARHGARMAAKSTASEDEASSSVAAILNEAGLGNSGYEVQFTSAASSGDTLRVEVVVPYEGHLDITGVPFFPVPTNLRAAVSMAKEGP